MKAALLPALFLLAAIGCEGGARPSPDVGNGKLKVLATTGMVADLIRNVGTSHVEVQQLMGTGVDPHLYKATRDDVRRIEDADIVFYSGLMLEGKLSDTFVKVARKKPVVAVTEQIDKSHLLEPEEMQGHFDPHVWMDVSAWSSCIDVAVDALTELDPEHADEYAAEGEAYRQELEQLHDYSRTALATIPSEQRVLITSHDAFNYFGRAYSLDVQGVQGISTESRAGLQRVNHLVDLIVARRITAVFVESSVSRKSMQALVDGAAAQGHDVVIGGELFSDAMGPAGTYEGTYIGMIDHNVTAVTRALGGDAKPGGMQGQLSTSQDDSP